MYHNKLKRLNALIEKRGTQTNNLTAEEQREYSTLIDWHHAHH